MLNLDKFSTFFLLSRVSRAATQIYQRELAPLNISAPQGNILLILSSSREVAQSDVVKILMLDKANVSSLVRTLRDEGLLTVRNEFSDGRKSILSLTEKGRTLVKKLNRVERKVNRSVEQIATRGDMNRFRQTLNSILKSLS